MLIGLAAPSRTHGRERYVTRASPGPLAPCPVPFTRSLTAPLPQLSRAKAAVDASASPPISTGMRRRAASPTPPPQAPGRLLRAIPLATPLQVPPLPPTPSLPRARVLLPRPPPRGTPGHLRRPTPRALPNVAQRASAKALLTRPHLLSRPQQQHLGRRVRESVRAARRPPPSGFPTVYGRST